MSLKPGSLPGSSPSWWDQAGGAIVATRDWVNERLNYSTSSQLINKPTESGVRFGQPQYFDERIKEGIPKFLAGVSLVTGGMAGGVANAIWGGIGAVGSLLSGPGGQTEQTQTTTTTATDTSQGNQPTIIDLSGLGNKGSDAGFNMGNMMMMMMMMSMMFSSMKNSKRKDDPYEFNE